MGRNMGKRVKAPVEGPSKVEEELTDEEPTFDVPYVLAAHCDSQLTLLGSDDEKWNLLKRYRYAYPVLQASQADIWGK